MFTCNSDNDEHKEPSVQPKTSVKIALNQSETALAEDALLACVVDATIEEMEMEQKRRKEAILFQYGYQYIHKINDTSQGELFRAKVNQNSSQKSDKLFVAIKRTNKELYSQGISIEDAINVTWCVDEDALKEVDILRYLTQNKRGSHAVYIRKFIKFFETKNDYYLVMKHIKDGVSFKEFIEKAHGYIKEKKLKYQRYKKTIKYLFWQLCTTMHWLHVDMKCCHLNLMLENVMIKNGGFKILSNGNVEINPNLSIKLTNFDYAEVFHDGSFECNKGASSSSLFERVQYCSPEILEQYGSYDPRKADNWALGMMLFHALIGFPLYDNLRHSTNKRSAYSSLMNGKLKDYMHRIGIDTVLDGSELSLITSLLNLDESKRFESVQILQHLWFNEYYLWYKRKEMLKTRYI